MPSPSPPPTALIIFFVSTKQQKVGAETDSPKTTKSPKTEKKQKQSTEDGEEASEEDGSEIEEGDGNDAAEKQKLKKATEEEDDEDDWENYKMESKKENSLDTKLKESHPVHCPYFPGVGV